MAVQGSEDDKSFYDCKVYSNKEDRPTEKTLCVHDYQEDLYYCKSWECEVPSCPSEEQVDQDEEPCPLCPGTNYRTSLYIVASSPRKGSYFLYYYESITRAYYKKSSPIISQLDFYVRSILKMITHWYKFVCYVCLYYLLFQVHVRPGVRFTPWGRRFPVMTGWTAVGVSALGWRSLQWLRKISSVFVELLFLQNTSNTCWRNFFLLKPIKKYTHFVSLFWTSFYFIFLFYSFFFFFFALFLKNKKRFHHACKID